MQDSRALLNLLNNTYATTQNNIVFSDEDQDGVTSNGMDIVPVNNPMDLSIFDAEETPDKASAKQKEMIEKARKKFTRSLNDVEFVLERAVNIVATKENINTAELEVDFGDWPFTDANGIMVRHIRYDAEKNGLPSSTSYWISFDELFQTKEDEQKPPKEVKLDGSTWVRKEEEEKIEVDIPKDNTLDFSRISVVNTTGTHSTFAPNKSTVLFSYQDYRNNKRDLFIPVTATEQTPLQLEDKIDLSEEKTRRNVLKNLQLFTVKGVLRYTTYK